ncbi:MAG TPA: archease [archaeon]|nr:archease [archaeon]
MFETFPHKADAGIRGYGKTLEEAFQEAGKAMFSIMVELKDVKPKTEIPVAAVSNTKDSLFIEFLNELIYLRDIHSMFFSEFELERILPMNAGYSLKGKAFGEKIDLKKHEVKTEVKAASYHQLKIEKTYKGFMVQTVVDV